MEMDEEINLPEELEWVEEEHGEIKLLASEINEEIQKNQSPKFMLVEPLSMTVKTAKGYSKRPSIGGEEFKVTGCYMGKRKKLIYTFKPLYAADFTEMEMEEHIANRSFAGFSKHIKDITGHDFQKRKAEAAKEASLKAEQEKLKARQEQYADIGFGTW